MMNFTFLVRVAYSVNLDLLQNKRHPMCKQSVTILLLQKRLGSKNKNRKQKGTNGQIYKGTKGQRQNPRHSLMHSPVDQKTNSRCIISFMEERVQNWLAQDRDYDGCDGQLGCHTLHEVFKKHQINTKNTLGTRGTPVAPGTAKI